MRIHAEIVEMCFLPNTPVKCGHNGRLQKLSIFCALSITGTIETRLEIRCIVQDPLSPQLFRHMFKFFCSNYLTQGFVLSQFTRFEKNTKSSAIMSQNRVIH